MPPGSAAPRQAKCMWRNHRFVWLVYAWMFSEAEYYGTAFFLVYPLGSMVGFYYWDFFFFGQRFCEGSLLHSVGMLKPEMRWLNIKGIFLQFRHLSGVWKISLWNSLDDFFRRVLQEQGGILKPEPVFFATDYLLEDHRTFLLSNLIPEAYKSEYNCLFLVLHQSQSYLSIWQKNTWIFSCESRMNQDETLLSLKSKGGSQLLKPLWGWKLSACFFKTRKKET